MKRKEFLPDMEPFDELEKSRVAYSLKIIISVSIVLLSILSVVRLLLRPAPNISDYLLWMMTGIIIIISIFSKRDKNRYAGLLYVVITWIPLTLLAWTHVGVKDIAVVGYIVCILFAMNITLYWQANTVFLLSIISIWGLFYAEYNHIIIPTEESSITYTIEYSVILGLVMVLLNINRRNQLFYYKSLQKEFAEKISAERSLHESESLIKSISNNLSMGMIYQIVKKPDGPSRFTYLSNSVRDLYGISPEEGIADASLIFNRIHKDDIDALLAAENESASTLNVLKQEFRIIDQSGSTRWSSVVSTPRKLEDGSVCFDGIEFDITESKKIKERERINVHNLEYISQSSLALVNMSLDENIYHAIGERLGKLLPEDSIVVLREFDPIINSFKTKFITNAEGNLEQIVEKFGFDPLEMALDYSPKFKKILVSGLLVKVEEDPSNVVTDLSDNVRNNINRYIGSRSYYEMGFVKDSNLFGSLTIIVYHEIPSPELKVLEAFGNQISIILDKRRTEEAIRFQSRLKELMMNMATTYINLPLKDVETAIHISLGELGEVVKADQVSIFYYNFQEGYASASNEWTRKGNEPLISSFQRISLKENTYWWNLDLHRRGEPIFISDIQSNVKGDLRNVFEKAGIKSMLSVPLMNAGDCLGFLSISWNRQNNTFPVDELKIMKVFALMLVNIGTRKKSEESIQKSEEKFRDLVENINDVFFTLDSQGIITYISPQISHIYNYTPEELTGHPFFDIIYPDDLPNLKSGFMDTRENRLKPREFRYLDKDGQIRWAQTSSRPIMEDGQAVGVRGLFSDITSRKLAEEELRKLSMAVVQSPAIILITNLAGNIEYVNPRFCQVTGYTLGEVIGRNPNILKSENTPKEVYHDLWSKITNGKEWRGELQNKKKNGDLYWEAANISPIINNNGKTTHYLAVKEDITERKDATRRIFDIIIETEERERLRYSHELHDGLGPILSTINLYFQMLAENTETDQKDAIITRANSCIDEAIRTIKEISYNLSPSVLSNFGILSGIHNFISRVNETEKLFIDFDCNTNKRFEKNIEITIYRIITELINNTIKYSGATNAEVGLNYYDIDSHIVLDYMDNGCGFDLNETMSARKGLGLSNIYQRISTLDGKINIETDPGKGVKVHIELQVSK